MKNVLLGVIVLLLFLYLTKPDEIYHKYYVSVPLKNLVDKKTERKAIRILARGSIDLAVDELVYYKDYVIASKTYFVINGNEVTIAWGVGSKIRPTLTVFEVKRIIEENTELTL